MIRVENIETWGFEYAIRVMRDFMNSWNGSDSYINKSTIYHDNEPFITAHKFVIGHNDLDLMKKLIKAGTDHSKFMRMINVTCDITAPLYWWGEFDIYKVGAVRNYCSTMHTIHEKEFTLEDFSCEHLCNMADEWIPYTGNLRYIVNSKDMLSEIVDVLNCLRENYLGMKDKKYWWQIIQLLPSSYNQKKTVTMNYENVLSMIEYRANYKLDEWCSFVEILKTLPYIEELIE